MKIFDDVKVWFESFALATITGLRSYGEYKKAEKMATVRVLFATSDHHLYGIDELIEAVIDNDKDIAKIKAFERIFFGHEKRGITSYRTSGGRDYIVVSDGDHIVKNLEEIADKMRIKAKSGMPQYFLELSEITKDNEEMQKKLSDLGIKTLGITLDLNIDDDHKDKKDFTFLADKVQGHAFFKGLTSFSNKTILFVFLIGGFFFSSLESIMIIMLIFFYLILRVLIH
jgi:hypothetical protein